MQEVKPIMVHIIACGNSPYFGEALRALAGQTRRDFQIVVVDNDPRESVAAWLQTTFPEVITLRNFRPQSLARAANQALAFTFARWNEIGLEGKFVLFLEAETVLAPDALERLVRACELDHDLSQVCPAICLAEYEAGANGGEGETVQTPLVACAGVGVNRWRNLVPLFTGSDISSLSFEPQAIFGSSSAACLVRASALAELKEGTDEWFDARLWAGQFWSDVMWRARAYGQKVCLLPAARAWSFTLTPRRVRGRWRLSWPAGPWYGRGSLERRLARWDIRAWQLKNETIGLAARHAPWIIAGWCVAVWYSLVQPRFFFAAWRWWLAAPHLVLKRFRARRKRSVVSREMVRWFV